jgi:hypothetical protein
MKSFRVLLMLTILLATSSVVHAQSPSAASLEALRRLAQAQCPDKGTTFRIELAEDRSHAFLIPDKGSTFRFELAEDRSHAFLVVDNEPMPSWHVQMMQQTAATWQRLRAMCSAGQQDTTCCEAAAGVVKSCAAGQAPKSCCCAKACACCETCKEKKTTAQAPPMPKPVPLTLEMQRMIAGLHGITQPQPPPFPVAATPPCVPPAYGPGIVQVMPVPSVRVVQIVQMAHPMKPVHLVTPDLEAHCERMQHRGDTVILEGNVLLLCKKHAMPIRVEAQRVIVNMKDGSFTVESGALPPPITTFGVQRTSAVQPLQYEMNLTGSQIYFPDFGRHNFGPAAGQGTTGCQNGVSLEITGRALQLDERLRGALQPARGSLMLGRGINSDNGVVGNPSLYVPHVREGLNTAPQTAPDLDILFRFFSEWCR